jgi:hypothetical protein
MPCLPCTTNEAIALLIDKMTARAIDVACQQRSGRTRYAGAKAALKRLRMAQKIVEDNGVLRSSEIRAKTTIGTKAIEQLKAHGKLKECETGFSVSSCITYRRLLLRKQWITVEGSFEVTWTWIGPPNASWNEINKMNSRGDRHSPAKRKEHDNK